MVTIDQVARVFAEAGCSVSYEDENAIIVEDLTHAGTIVVEGGRVVVFEWDEKAESLKGSIGNL